MRNGFIPDEDRIRWEMLKLCEELLLKAVQVLFNNCLHEG